MGWVQCIGQNGGSGGDAPVFSETIIASNPSANASFTFDDDYHDYDFVRFKVLNSDTSNISYYVTTPSTIDAAFSKASRFTLNEYQSNLYCTYSQNSLTWTLTNSRSCKIVEVVGFTCLNATVNETVIYAAPSLSSSEVSITTQDDLTDYDLILFCANSSDPTEILPCAHFASYIDFSGFMTFNFYRGVKQIQISEHEISSARYFYVIGIKFT